MQIKQASTHQTTRSNQPHPQLKSPHFSSNSTCHSSHDRPTLQASPPQYQDDLSTVPLVASCCCCTPDDPVDMAVVVVTSIPPGPLFLLNIFLLSFFFLLFAPAAPDGRGRVVEGGSASLCFVRLLRRLNRNFTSHDDCIPTLIVECIYAGQSIEYSLLWQLHCIATNLYQHSVPLSSQQQTTGSD